MVPKAVGTMAGGLPGLHVPPPFLFSRLEVK
jgi:hypothetical protein